MTECLNVLIWVVGTSVPCASSTTEENAEAQVQKNGAVQGSLVSEEMLRDLSPLKRAKCVWDGRSSDPTLIDEVALQNAIENSSGWIRAVLRPEYVPEDIKKRIQGVVDDVMGWDATRVRFDRDGLRFLVTQTASHIMVVVRPHDRDGPASCCSPPAPEARLRATIENVFRHGRVILHMSSVIDEVPSGIRMRVRRLPSGIEDPAALEEQRHILQDELRKLDDGLPDHLRAGPFSHWWGTVYAMSDGCTVVVHARKCTGGGVMADLVKDWFRGRKLQGNHARFSPEPPRESRTTEDEVP